MAPLLVRMTPALQPTLATMRPGMDRQLTKEGTAPSVFVTKRSGNDSRLIVSDQESTWPRNAVILMLVMNGAGTLWDSLALTVSSTLMVAVDARGNVTHLNQNLSADAKLAVIRIGTLLAGAILPRPV